MIFSYIYQEHYLFLPIYNYHQRKYVFSLYIDNMSTLSFFCILPRLVSFLIYIYRRNSIFFFLVFPRDKCMFHYMGIIKALFLQSLPRRYGISIYIQGFLLYILDGILPIYRITPSFSQDLPRICVFPYIGETMLFLLIYRKQTLFLFSFSPRIYMCFLYIQGKQYFFLYRCLFFSLFLPRIQGCLYIQEPLSFLYIAQ